LALGWAVIVRFWEGAAVVTDERLRRDAGQSVSLTTPYREPIISFSSTQTHYITQICTNLHFTAWNTPKLLKTRRQ